MEMRAAGTLDSNHQSFNQPLFSMHQEFLSDILLHSTILKTFYIVFYCRQEQIFEGFALRDPHPLKPLCDRQISNLDLQPEFTFYGLQFSRK
jgi:hypothetical protein